MKHIKITIQMITFIFILLLVSCTTPHSHTLSDVLYDNEYHYQECTECHEVVSKELHSFDEGIITIQATSTKDGIKEYHCTKCAYIKEENYSLTIKEPLVIDVDHLGLIDYVTYNKVLVNELYPEEFTIKKLDGYISSKSITNITKIICHVFGTYDNLKMYDDENIQIKPKIEQVTENEQTNVKYTYEFNSSINSFKLINPSNYDVNLFSITIYYDGSIFNKETYIDVSGEKTLTGQTIKKMDDLTIVNVEINPLNPSNFIIKPNGYIICEDLKNIQYMELIEGSRDISVYANTTGTGTNIGWTYNATTLKTIYNFNNDNSFMIINKTNKDLEIGCLVIHYTTSTPDTKIISISEANKIGSTLSSSKGVTTDTYQIKGIITNINGKEIEIKGDDVIYAYMDETPTNMYMGYEVTIEGKIQNYYGKIEIIDYLLIDYVETTYSVGIDDIEHGKIIVDKMTNIKWGEEISIEIIPDSDYEIVSLTINGKTQSVQNNLCKYIVTNDLEITMRFQLISTSVKETEKTYTISEYPKGIQYASNELHELDDKISISSTLCHWTDELRIYSSSKNNGNVVLHSVDEIKSIIINAGYSVDNLNVYTSSDGEDYQLFTTIKTVATYNDYELTISDSTWRYLKFDVEGTNQIRIKSFTITTVNTKEEEIIEVEDIKLGFTSLTMIVNTNKIVQPIVYPVNATNKSLSFSSSNESVATISNSGLINALEIGNTTITIKAINNIEFSFILTVEKESIDTDEDFFTIYNIEMMGTYGDANLIKYGDYDILIDGGTNSDTSYIKQILDEKVEDHVLEYLIISHPDTDHYEGLLNMVALTSIEEIENVVTNGNTDNSIILNALRSKYTNTNYQVITDIVTIEKKIYTVQVDKEFTLNFYYQDNYTNSSSNKNNQSIVSTIQYQNCIVFFGGDLESSGCSSVMKYYPNLTEESNYVIYKALHHGSKGTNTKEFLNYIKPDMCFISAGMNLSEPNYTPAYGTHPYLEAVARMGDVTKEVYWSGICGTIEITCNGEDSICKGTGRSKDYYYSTKNASSTYIKASITLEKNCTFFESDYYYMAKDFLGYPDYL